MGDSGRGDSGWLLGGKSVDFRVTLEVSDADANDGKTCRVDYDIIRLSVNILRSTTTLTASPGRYETRPPIR